MTTLTRKVCHIWEIHITKKCTNEPPKRGSVHPSHTQNLNQTKQSITHFALYYSMYAELVPFLHTTNSW